MNQCLIYKRIVSIFFINFYFCNQFSTPSYKSLYKEACCISNDTICQTDCNPPLKTLFLPLSTSQNLYTQYHKNEYQKFDISLTYRFQQASNPNDIALSLCNQNPLLFVGSIYGEDSSRPTKSLIPEYFGLGSDTNTSFYLTPQVRNQILDLELSFQGEHAWCQVNIPLVKGQWKTNILPIVNNTLVGNNPLEPEASTYIYNIGQTFNSFPEGNSIPPTGNNPDNQNYNVLPMLGSTAPVKPNYTGAYIITQTDASDYDSYQGPSLLTVSDQNTGSINLSNSIYAIGFVGDNTLNSENWKLNIGSWQQVDYEALRYHAPYTEIVNQISTIVPATLEHIEDYKLTGTILNVADATTNGIAPNTIQMTQNKLNQATTIEQALSGEYNFNQLLNRLYNNFNFNQDGAIQTWGIADIIVWLGYDFYNNQKKHIGFYVHGVIPTGTNITQEWYQYILNPVIGNGHHYQLGLGLSSHYVFCSRRNYSLTCNINGYIDHVFAAKQFRVFDKLNNPMSRYAVLKALKYTGGANENLFNDDYEYQNLDILGNINNAYLMVSNNFKGECIIDITMKSICCEAGFGYAFSGLSADSINCNAIPMYNTDSLTVQDQIYYGYKGNTPMSNLLFMNITPGEEVFNPENNPLELCPNSTTTLCNYPVAADFPPSTTTPTLQPNPNTLYIKSSGDVAIGGNSGAYLYGESSGGESNGEEYAGTISEDVFILPDIKANTTNIINTSGLMNAQILNRIFGHIEYNWDSLYTPTIGIIGSYGFGSQKYFTALYWDVGFYIGCSF